LIDWREENGSRRGVTVGRQVRQGDVLPRILVTGVRPNVDGGKYAVKRIVGDVLRVSADVIKEGHDLHAAEVRLRQPGARTWRAVAMEYRYNEDEWRANVDLPEEGAFEYTVAVWTDGYASWLDELGRKVGAGRDVASEALEGIALVRAVAEKRKGKISASLSAAAERMAGAAPGPELVEIAGRAALIAAMTEHQERGDLSTYAGWLPLVVDRERARFGAWYEMFPRSQGKTPGEHGTMRDATDALERVRDLGFDVVYLPPVHPIGTTNRKGRNNALTAAPGDPGSPWAIGGEAGGHDAIEPALGTMEDFDALVAKAGGLGMEIALDFAIQCSPDHPYTREHPEWFRRRPDGTIKYAENPPKRYEDIVALDMWCEDWPALWEELKRVVLHWVEHGVRIFRVDNPHTKPLAFWDWLIREVKARHPDVLFLAEAFTRPKRLQLLAKIGFSQSYTYFTWRNERREIERYLEELTTTEQADFLRPNFFANTPDILHEYLQTGGRPAFKVRLALAATLSPTYGIYSGFELIENTPLRPGSEEYLDSEKYEVKVRDWEAGGNINGFIRTVNAARRENAAMRLYRNLVFHDANNPLILSYSKATEDGSNRVLVVANLDPFAAQEATIRLNGDALGIDPASAYAVHDLITGRRHEWRGLENYVRLDPEEEPIHLFRIEEA
jgi:starch synthase (maltosyl-transferring)